MKSYLKCLFFKIKTPLILSYIVTMVRLTAKKVFRVSMMLHECCL